MSARTETKLSRRGFATALFVVLALSALLRGVFPAADPPWNPTVGIVWHDEGAWVHNARNKALFGEWSQDAWNPMYIAPVFTALEYAAFDLFGVGVRQARLVPEVAGLASVWLLALGVARLAGRRAGLIAAALLGTNYVYVMWNRAALMEGPMVGFMVASWYCYVRARTQPLWGWASAAGALLAFFTKASAAFFVAALALDACVTLGTGWKFGRTAEADLRVGATGKAGLRAGATGKADLKVGTTSRETEGDRRSAAWHTLAGLAVCGALALALFVLPNWTDYRFYNWQMSVTRKPSYDLKSFIDRVTWFPILHDIFTRMWFVLTLGVAAALGLLARFREAAPGERLLLFWLGLGATELILHDVGNERRFIFFIPALVGLASIALGRDRVIVHESAASIRRGRAWLALPLVLFASYVVAGALVRLAFLYQVSPNVRMAAVVAVLFTTVVYATWPRIPRSLSRHGWSPRAALWVALLVSGGQLAQFGQWAAGRSYKNYAASVELGRRLPAGTLVHGKLANGLALENGIKPVFVGRGFGNYDDRKTRNDVRYILTYVAPSVGYESQARNPVIADVLDAYPDRKIIMTFEVAETATGRDRAALIDKFGTGRQ